MFVFSGSDSHSADLGKFALFSFIRPVLDNKTPKVYDVNGLLSSESWRSHSVTDGLKNGDAGSSSLAAKGFRSVRPNLQDKKSPTQVRNPTNITFLFVLKHLQEEQLMFPLIILFVVWPELILAHCILIG